jgi:hypothetical protein
MSLQFTPNQAPANGVVAMWNLITALIAAGWTKIQDSDGSTYSNTGVQLTGAGSGANGMNNAKSWAVLQSPAGASSRQLCLQNTFSTGDYWRIKYSRSAGFSGGTPDAVTVPAATDEVVIFGNGTDASPGNVQYFPAAGGYYQQIAADTSAPYGFYMFVYLKVSGSTYSSLVFDPMISGTFANTDNDPIVIYVSGATADAVTTTYLSSESSGPSAWYKYGLAGATFVRCPALMLSNTTTQIFPGLAGQNAYTGNDLIAPIMYHRRGNLSAPVGNKGLSTLLAWKGSARTTGDTLASKAWIVIGDVCAKWDSTTVPSL